MNIACCQNCRKVVILNNKALGLLWDEEKKDNINPLSRIDSIYPCCNDPFHLWVIDPPDISKGIIKTLTHDVNKVKEVK